ncbi:PadR family transcriptional regulator [Marinitenerispora sediminis]|uniref:Transcriptional regulator n=1 Tax=Marinitenerispora sediminis TaxID=1931232 RepID=A0A368T9L5_9ACTN|nr:PadR family transcriptional regulator [Marinitenerispora sediminis]RCV52807.1 transcriptional regulator [Marinitenerispora sediminis]RCV59912.1 transcriptional regulator [Marinitenerispora sediminis]RCV61328.1 transcriptional regulator [Marinitenerispora sediminis]
MSATRLLVLGVVRMHGRAHGYRVGRELLSWGTEQWANVKWGSIYHALKQLTKEGKLSATAEPGDSAPARTVYELTEDGEAEFMRLLRDALGSADHRPDVLGAGLTLLPALTRREAVRLLRRRLAELEAALDRLSALLERPGLSGAPAHVRELHGLWVDTTQGGAAWTRRLIERLEAGTYVMAGEAGATFGAPAEVPDAGVD